MSQMKKTRRIQIGPVELTVAMPQEVADWVTGNPVYRRVVRPTVDRVNRFGGPGPVLNAQVSPRRPDPAPATPEARAIIERIAGRRWYHSIDLGHGVVTPGFVDHRDQLPYYSLPASLEGKRCLDVATFDGFWAFEFERRGAAEVVAADISRWTQADVPRLMLKDPAAFELDEETGGGFEIAADVLGSKVKRIETSVYDLDPAKIGTFDLVFISDLLVHLRDPQLALERAFAVCSGEVIVADVYTPTLEGFGGAALAQLTAPGETWWLMSVAALQLMMTVAGFEPVDEVSRFVLNADVNDVIHKVVLRGKALETPTWYYQALDWKQEQVRRRTALQSDLARPEAELVSTNGVARINLI
jgi:tRNA (mo5U34)-methyltransferase